MAGPGALFLWFSGFSCPSSGPDFQVLSTELRLDVTGQIIYEAATGKRITKQTRTPGCPTTVTLLHDPRLAARPGPSTSPAGPELGDVSPGAFGRGEGG